MPSKCYPWLQDDDAYPMTADYVDFLTYRCWTDVDPGDVVWPYDVRYAEPLAS